MRIDLFRWAVPVDLDRAESSALSFRSMSFLKEARMPGKSKPPLKSQIPQNDPQELAND
jgi:hypothetical protein